MLKAVNRSLFEKDENSKLNILLNVLLIAITVILVLEVVFSSIFSGIYVIGPSMNNTLHGATETEVKDANGKRWKIASLDGDYLYINKFATPSYGDIVVANKKETDGTVTTIIKRVIALGGDTVRIYRGELQIKYSPDSALYSGTDDFIVVEESYVSSNNNAPSNRVNTFPRDEQGYYDPNGYYIEKNCVFLLGDNRNVSEDSRINGSFPLSSIQGVVTDWSLNGKSFFTSVHKFFSFDVPGFFGFDGRIKREIN